MPDVVIRELWTYPIKGCQGVAHEAVTVSALGIPGDRAFTIWKDGALVDQKDTPRAASIGARVDLEAGTLVLHHAEAGKLVHAIRAEGERLPGKWVLDAFETVDQGDAVADWLSAILGEPVRLVAADAAWKINFPIPQMALLHEQPKRSFTAASPLSLANRASLEALNAQLDAPVPMDRFRMNVVVEGIDAHAEDALTEIRGDSVHLRHVTPAERCAIVSTDQTTGDRDRGSLLRFLPEKTKEDRFGSGRIFGTYLRVERAGTLRVGETLKVA
ncbi:MAG: MOSC N-terminal beta barrel domain-containing protein [Myxococcota bacterium]